MAGVVQEREGWGALGKGENSQGNGVEPYLPEKREIQVQEITKEYPDRTAMGNNSDCPFSVV